MPFSLYEMLWFVLIYGFLGWCSEVVFAAVNTGKFVNRGFLNGPICPIYGFGMLIVLLCLQPFADHLPLLFIGSVVLTSALEFVTGFVLEKVFHEKWWDYADTPFNIKGYICLKFSLLWGLAGTFIVRIVQPPIQKLVEWVPPTVGTVVLIALLALFLADFVITLIAVLKFPKRLRAILELEHLLNTVSDGIGSNLSEGVTTLRDKNEELKTTLQEKNGELRSTLMEKNDELKAVIEEKRADIEAKRAHYKALLEQKNFVHKRLIKAFPQIGKGRYHEAIERIRSYHRSAGKTDPSPKN